MPQLIQQAHTQIYGSAQEVVIANWGAKNKL